MAQARWEAAGISVRGARHLADGLPCQDAVRVYQDDRLVILTVADGHGDPKHARSDEVGGSSPPASSIFCYQ